MSTSTVDLQINATIKIENGKSILEDSDTWAEKLNSWMQANDSIKSQYTESELLTLVFGLELKSITKAHKMKLSDTAQKLDWTKNRREASERRSYFYQIPHSALVK